MTEFFTTGFLRHNCYTETKQKVHGLNLGKAGQWNVVRLH